MRVEDFRAFLDISLQLREKLITRNSFKLIEWSIKTFRDESYMSIVVEASKDTDMQRNNYDVLNGDDLECLELDLDHETSLPVASEITNPVYLTFDIILHPTFQVPTVFVTGCKKSGGQVTIEAVQTELSRFNHMEESPIETNEQHTDQRHYKFGQFEVEEHPYTGAIVCSLHVCSMVSKLEAWSSNSVVFTLNWWSLFGPHFGYAIEPQTYVSFTATSL